MSEQTVQPSELDVSSPASLSVALVRARFNHTITQSLLDGAVRTLREAGIPEDNLHSFHVPGAFELPQATADVDQHLDTDGIVPLGAVVRGETSHFDYICSAATSGLQEVALEKDVPVVFGVLTCDTQEQARARAGLTEDGTNKGVESAQALLQMIHLRQNLSRSGTASSS